MRAWIRVESVSVEPASSRRAAARAAAEAAQAALSALGTGTGTGTSLDCQATDALCTGAGGAHASAVARVFGTDFFRIYFKKTRETRSLSLRFWPEREREELIPSFAPNTEFFSVSFSRSNKRESRRARRRGQTKARSSISLSLS